MIRFDFRTNAEKDERSPFCKPKIYFSCHPSDFDAVFAGDEVSCFDKICGDILDEANKDCAIFYALDKDVPFSEEEIETALGGMNLFVIAVSTRMLTELNQSTQVYQVIEYAKKNRRPILPIMMDIPSGDMLDKYSLPENFGKMQFIDPHDENKNISYQNRLSNYLDEWLISPEDIEKIRSSFSTSIFMSYRKKDRKHAAELMRLIHRELQMFDIAIWYDEFLPLGEDWRISISDAMQYVKERSNLFVLIVTPAVLELVDNEKNFVTKEECPAAHDMGMKILPVEMEATDYAMLKKQVDFLPIPKSKNSDEFGTEVALIGNWSKGKKGFSPEQLYYMGLAYLFGVYAEVDAEMALTLLQMSAQAGYGTALKQIVHIAETLDNVGNYSAAADVYNMIYECQIELYGENSEEALETRISYWRSQFLTCESDKLDAALTAYNDMLDRLPQNDARLDEIYFYVAEIYNISDRSDEAIRVLKLLADRFSESDSGNENDLLKKAKLCSVLGDVYEKRGEYKKAIDSQQAAIDILKEHYSDNYRDIILIRRKIAENYRIMGEVSEALKMHREILEIKRKSKYFGAKHLETVLTMSDIVEILSASDDIDGAHDEALELAEKALNICDDNYRDVLTVPLLFHMRAYEILLGRMPGNENDVLRIGIHMDRILELKRKMRSVDTCEDLEDERLYGKVYVTMGNVARGVEVFEEAYAAALRIKDDKLVCELAKDLAGDLAYNCFELFKECKKNHDIKKANAYLAKSYEACLHHYGAFHEVTLATQSLLSDAKRKKKKKKK